MYHLIAFIEIVPLVVSYPWLQRCRGAVCVAHSRRLGIRARSRHTPSVRCQDVRVRYCSRRSHCGRMPS